MGTSHRFADVERLDQIDPERRYTGRELIDIIRARTFPPYKGAYLEAAGGRVYLCLKLLGEEQMDARPEAVGREDDD